MPSWHTSLRCPCGTQTVTVPSTDPVLAPPSWLISAPEAGRWGVYGGPGSRATCPRAPWRAARRHFGGHTARQHLLAGGTPSGFGSGGCQSVVLKAHCLITSPCFLDTNFDAMFLAFHVLPFCCFFSHLNVHSASLKPRGSLPGQHLGPSPFHSTYC